MKKSLTGILTITVFLLAAAPPDGFMFTGTDIDPDCGKIGMNEKWREIEESKELSFTPEPADNEQGFIIYSKHYMENTSPRTRPGKHEQLSELRCFAVPGEYEPVNFLIYPLRDLNHVQVAVSDLTGKNGVILGENIQVHFLVPLSFKDYQHENRYYWRHEIMVRRLEETLRQGESARYWLTVFIPNHTQEGVYSGNVMLRANGKIHEIPLKVRVFPVTRMVNDGIERGMYIGGHQRQEFYRRKMYLDMRENGMNTVSPCNFAAHPSWQDGKIQLDFTMLDLEMKLYREVGFTHPVPIDMRPIQAFISTLEKTIKEYEKAGKTFPSTYSIQTPSFDVSPTFSEFESREYKRIVNQILKHAEEKNYPKLYFLPQEESTNKGTRVQQLKRFSKLLKECGVMTTAWSNGPWGGIDELQDIDSDMDIRYYNYVNPSIYRNTKKSNDFFGIYNHGDRVMFGFFAERVKAEGVMQWAYIFDNTKNMLCRSTGYHNDGVTYVGTTGPLWSPAWQRIREGIDDSDFIFTLRSLIDEAKKSGDEELKKQAFESKRVLDEIIANFPDDTAQLNQFTAALAGEQLDTWRLRIIREIMKFQGKKKKTDPREQVLELGKDMLVSLMRQTGKEVSSDIQNDNTMMVIPKADSFERAVSTEPFLLTYQMAWARKRAWAATSIGQVKPEVAPQTTSARLYFDNHYLHIDFDCAESQMSKILANTVNRDGAVYSDDAVEIFVRPNLSENRYYQIAVNSKGVLFDAIWEIRDGKRYRVPEPWDPKILTNPRKAVDRWGVSIAVPFSAFGLEKAPSDGTMWKLNLAREQQPTPGGEYSSWSMVERTFHEQERWGTLFFAQVPEAVIGAVDASNILLGNSPILVRVINLQSRPFQGKIASASEGVFEVEPSAPIDMTDTNAIFPLNGHAKEIGLYSVTLLLSDSAGKLLSQSKISGRIPEPIVLALRQKELSGNNIIADLSVNISQSMLESHEIECTIQGEKYERKTSLPVSQPGEYQMVMRTANLPVGKYTLALSLKEKTNRHLIKEVNQEFTVIERVF